MKEQRAGNGKLAHVFNPVFKCNVKTIEFHLLDGVGGASEEFTSIKDDAVNEVYDVVYIKKDMLAVQDIVHNGPIYLEAGDKIVFAYANTNKRTWGLTIIYET